MKKSAGRLASLDAFRGFDILVMVFVNYISGLPGIPFFLRHAKAEMDAFTLTDVVFPGFLFIVGVAIPLSLEKRLASGDRLGKILVRVFVRTAGLLFLGVIMVNRESYSAQATGIGRDFWYFLAYAAAILLWMSYPGTESRSRRRLYLAMRLAAGLLLVFLVIIFRGQAADGSIQALRHSWWGILGMIGWTYLAGSLVYLLLRGDRAGLMGALGLMIFLYIGARHGALGFLKPVNDFVDIGNIFGSHTAIVTAGMVVGTFFTARSAGMRHGARMAWLAAFGGALLTSGFLLRPLHGFSKIRGTESYCLATSGICCLLFLLFYGFMDVLKLRGWALFLRPVGANPLIAYILPDIVHIVFGFASGLAGINLWRTLWPNWERGGGAGMLSAAAMTGIILFLTWALTRGKIILKI